MSAMSSISSGYKVNCCEATREGTPGYEQTEVGVIPGDWPVSTIGAAFDIQSGKNSIQKTISAYQSHIWAINLSSGIG